MRIEGTAGRVTEDGIVLPTFDAVQEYAGAGIRAGLSSSTVRSYLDRMGFDVTAYEPLTEQVAIGEQLTAREARQLRLESAKRLEQDVHQLRPLPSD